MVTRVIMVESLSFTAFLATFIAAIRIRATTADRIPIKAACTISLSWNFEKKAAIRVIIINEGSTTPNIAAIAPYFPAIL